MLSLGLENTASLCSLMKLIRLRLIPTTKNCEKDNFLIILYRTLENKVTQNCFKEKVLLFTVHIYFFFRKCTLGILFTVFV